MTPSRPAPSKRRNQSAATLAVAGCRRQMDRRRGGGQAAIPVLCAGVLERLAAQIPIALAKQVEEYDGCRRLLGQHLHTRSGGMNAELQCIEIEAALGCDHDFPIEHAAGRQLRAQRFDQLGEIAVQRFFVAALNQDFVAIAKDQRAKPIPLRLENPVLPAGNSSTRLASIGRIGGFTGRFTL